MQAVEHAVSSAEVARLRLALLRIARKIRQHAPMKLDITPSQESVVVMLDRYGSMSIGDIALREGIASPSATRTVGVLESLGLVTRCRKPSNQRVVMVELTPIGVSTALLIHQERDAWLADRLATLSHGQVEGLIASLPTLESLLPDLDDVNTDP